MNATRLTEWRAAAAAGGEAGEDVRRCGSPTWNAIIINKAPFTHNSCTMSMNEYLLSSLLAVAVAVIVIVTVTVSVTVTVTVSANNARCVLIKLNANGIDGFNHKSPQFVALAINANCQLLSPLVVAINTHKHTHTFPLSLSLSRGMSGRPLHKNHINNFAANM